MRYLALCVGAVTVLAGGLYAGSASATTLERPEIGTCVKGAAKEYPYSNPQCTKESRGSDSGSYAWTPSTERPGEEVVESGETTVKAHGQTWICGHDYTTSAGTGYSSCYEKLKNSTVCTGGQDFEPGELESAPLHFGPDYIKASSTAKSTVGISAYPDEHLGAFSEFTCGETAVRITGGVIAPIAPTNRMSATFTAKFGASMKGVQKVTHFENGPTEVLECSVNTGAPQPCGLTSTETITMPEPIEIRTEVKAAK